MFQALFKTLGFCVSGSSKVSVARRLEQRAHDIHAKNAEVSHWNVGLHRSEMSHVQVRPETVVTGSPEQRLCKSVHFSWGTKARDTIVGRRVCVTLRHQMTGQRHPKTRAVYKESRGGPLQP
jgi:hypothetical protein